MDLSPSTTRASVGKSPPSSLKASGFIVPPSAPVETIMEDAETPGRPEMQHFDSGTTSGEDTDYALGPDGAFYPDPLASRHFSPNGASTVDSMSPLTNSTS